ncbi:MAG: hypothetical protein U0J83_07440, partial [Bulleidia sp.]|nr:hypothetical protein [Bulleidia sp.]
EILDSMPQEYGIYDKIMVHRKEVVGMLETEFDQKKWEKRFTEDGYEAGLEQGLEQGIAQGLEQGLEQGLKQKAEQTCRKMLQLGLSLEIIQKSTELSEEEILSIKEAMKL